MPDIQSWIDAGKNLGIGGLLTAFVLGLLSILKDAIKHRQDSDSARLKYEVEDNRERIKSGEARVELLQNQLDAANARLLPIAEERARAQEAEKHALALVDHYKNHAKQMETEADRAREAERLLRVEISNRDQVLYGLHATIEEYNKKVFDINGDPRGES